MRQKHGNFIGKSAASITDPVVSAIQQLHLKTQAMASDVQCGLIVRVVFCKLVIRKHKTFGLSKPIPMALTIQYDETCVEILSKWDFPILRGADMQGAGALRY